MIVHWLRHTTWDENAACGWAISVGPGWTIDMDAVTCEPCRAEFEPIPRRPSEPDPFAAASEAQ